MRIFMYYSLCLIFILTAFVTVSAQDRNDFITVSGKVNFVPSADHQEKYPFILKDQSGEVPEVVDTIRVDSQGVYTIKIPSDPPRFYAMDVYAWDRITFWADHDNLTINFRGEDTAKVKIKNPPFVLIENSEENEVVNMVNFVNYQTYQNMIYAGKLQYVAMQKEDSLWKSKTTDLMMHQYDVAAEYLKQIIKIYKNDPAVMYAIKSMNWRTNSTLMLTTLDYLIEKYPWLTEAQALKTTIVANIEQSKKIAIGEPAPDFKYPDLKGNMVNLNDFQGKYLIIDFWASWCGPCRAESPHVKEVYGKYKENGLEVLSVSIDTKEEAWKKAVQEDELDWPQVIAKDSKSLLKAYQFSGIPFMVLLDKEGKIIAKNVRGESLDAELSKLFD